MKPHAREIRSVAVCIDTRDGAGRNRLQGVSKFIRRLGWRMMLVRHGGRAAANEVARLSPDGIIAYIADRHLLDVALRLGIPLVDTALGECDVPMSVSISSAVIGRLAVDHLAHAGLKHFGYCGVKGRTASESRREQFAACLGIQDLPFFSDSASEGESNLAPLIRWLRKLPRPVGLLTFDDKLGERVLTACRWAKIAVPHEIAVLGIGDDELMCEVSWPTLSSISLPTSRLGFEAARMLATAMAGREIAKPHRQLSPSGIVVRGSTDMVTTDDTLVKSAIQVMREQTGGLIGAEQVAQSVAVSRRTLDRRFAEALGRTARAELLRLRMQTARTLLADTSTTIAEVASACGYGGPASFSRAFRQQTGRWPSEYRDDCRNM